MPTVDSEAAAEYILHKHHLLEGSQGTDVVQVVNDIIALHATSVGTPYISLSARIKSFQRKQLDEQFHVKRNLIRLSAMRGTLFIATTKSAPILFQATKTPDSQLSKRLQRWGIPPSEYHDIATRLLPGLKRGKTLPEIKKSLPKKMTRSVELKAGKSTLRMSNINVILNALMSTGMIVSEKTPGTLQITKANRYMLLKEVYPNLNLDSVKSEEARETLVKRYIRAFGPVAKQDIAWWTGFKETTVKETLASIEKELLHVKLDTFQREYLMLKDDFQQFIRLKPPKKRSLILLPFEDPYTKGYKLRDRLVDKEHERRTYVGGGVLPTILLDGKIVGTWNRNIEAGKGPIQLRFFNQPEKNTEKQAVQKALDIGRMMTGTEVQVETYVESS